MDDSCIYEAYRNLACAVIQQSAEDFINGECDEYAFYDWCMTSDFFDYVNIDREYFYVKVLKLKEKRKEGKTRGKKIKQGKAYGSKTIS